MSHLVPAPRSPYQSFWLSSSSLLIRCALLFLGSPSSSETKEIALNALQGFMHVLSHLGYVLVLNLSCLVVCILDNDVDVVYMARINGLQSKGYKHTRGAVLNSRHMESEGTTHNCLIAIEVVNVVIFSLPTSTAYLLQALRLNPLRSLGVNISNVSDIWRST